MRGPGLGSVRGTRRSKSGRCRLLFLEMWMKEEIGRQLKGVGGQGDCVCGSGEVQS